MDNAIYLFVHNVMGGSDCIFLPSSGFSILGESTVTDPGDEDYPLTSPNGVNVSNGDQLKEGRPCSPLVF